MITYRIENLIPPGKEIPADRLCWKSEKGLYRVAQKLVGLSEFDILVWNPIEARWIVESTHEDLSEAITKGEELEQEWIRFARMMDKTAKALGLAKYIPE